MSEHDDDDDDQSHYHFHISLRISHPDGDPDVFTRELGLEPWHHWKAGEPRRTRGGAPLEGRNEDTYWTGDVAAGRYPDPELNTAIARVLKWMSRHRSLLHRIRSEGGSTELSIGWYFLRQSGDVLSHETLRLAGDLRIDLSLDIYPPSQPQREHPVDPLPA